MKSVFSFFFIFFILILTNPAWAETKASSTTCQYVAAVPNTEPQLHEVHCGKLKAFILGDSKLAKLKIEIKKISGGKEVGTSTHELDAPPGPLSDYLEGSIETNKFINDKFDLHKDVESVVSVVPNGFSMPNDSTTIYTLQDGKYVSLGTIDEVNQKKQKEKEKALQEMETTYCFQEKDDPKTAIVEDVVRVLSYKDSCKGEDGNVKPICFMDVHCIKRDKGTEKIISYYRNNAVCAQVNGACPTANDCARDPDVSAVRKFAPDKPEASVDVELQNGSISK